MNLPLFFLRDDAVDSKVICVAFARYETVKHDGSSLSRRHGAGPRAGGG